MAIQQRVYGSSELIAKSPQKLYDADLGWDGADLRERIAVHCKFKHPAGDVDLYHFDRTAMKKTDHLDLERTLAAQGVESGSSVYVELIAGEQLAGVVRELSWLCGFGRYSEPPRDV